jgi:tetratricopeptide (TPR) repeat protein
MNTPQQYEALVKKALAVRTQIVERQNRGELVYDRDMAILCHELDFMNRLQQTQVVGQFFTLMGVIEAQRGHFVAAYDYFLSSLHYYEESGDQQRLTSALSNLGELHRHMGDFEQAVAYFDRARVLALKDENWTIASLVINNIGLLYLEQDEPARALEQLEEALEYSNRVKPAPISQAETFSGIARAHIALGQPEKAWESAQRALEISERANRSHDIADAYRTLGIIAARVPEQGGDPAQYFSQSRTIYLACHARAEYARTLLVEANWLLTIPRLDDAWRILIEAEQIFAELQLDGEQQEVRNLLDTLAPNRSPA